MCRFFPWPLVGCRHLLWLRAFGPFRGALGHALQREVQLEGTLPGGSATWACTNTDVRLIDLDWRILEGHLFRICCLLFPATYINLGKPPAWSLTVDLFCPVFGLVAICPDIVFERKQLVIARGFQQ